MIGHYCRDWTFWGAAKHTLAWSTQDTQEGNICSCVSYSHSWDYTYMPAGGLMVEHPLGKKPCRKQTPVQLKGSTLGCHSFGQDKKVTGKSLRWHMTVVKSAPGISESPLTVWCLAHGTCKTNGKWEVEGIFSVEFVHGPPYLVTEARCSYSMYFYASLESASRRCSPHWMMWVELTSMKGKGYRTVLQSCLPETLWEKLQGWVEWPGSIRKSPFFSLPSVEHCAPLTLNSVSEHYPKQQTTGICKAWHLSKCHPWHSSPVSTSSPLTAVLLLLLIYWDCVCISWDLGASNRNQLLQQKRKNYWKYMQTRDLWAKKFGKHKVEQVK